MGVDKSWKNNFARTINLDNFLAVLSQPGIAKRIFGFAHRYDFADDAENGGILDDAKFFELVTATWSRPGRMRPEGEKLPNIDKEY